MTRQIIEKIEQKMCEHLTEAQKGILHDTLVQCMMEETAAEASADTQSYLKIFLAAKRVEGCSEKTIRYYDSTIRNVLTAIGKEVKITEFDEAKVAKFITKIIVRRWMVTFVFYNGAKITKAYSNGQAGNKPGWNKKEVV